MVVFVLMCENCYYDLFSRVLTCRSITELHHWTDGPRSHNWLKITGYRNDSNVSVLIDVNNATCQQVTTPHSDKSFRLEVELPPAHDHLTVTAVLDGGECLDFPATMVYTKSDQSAMLPYHNNPSFCDNEPGECVFECDCSAMPCQRVFLAILSAPTGPRKLCEIFIT